MWTERVAGMRKRGEGRVQHRPGTLVKNIWRVRTPSPDCSEDGSDEEKRWLDGYGREIEVESKKSRVCEDAKEEDATSNN